MTVDLKLMQNYFSHPKKYFVNGEVRTGSPKLGHTTLYGDISDRLRNIYDISDRRGYLYDSAGLLTLHNPGVKAARRNRTRPVQVRYIFF